MAQIMGYICRNVRYICKNMGYIKQKLWGHLAKTIGYFMEYIL